MTNKLNLLLICLFVLGIVLGCGTDHDYREIKSRNSDKTISTKSIFNSWEVIDFQVGGVAALNQRQVESFLGSVISLGEEKSIYFGNECKKCDYAYEHYKNPSSYLTKLGGLDYGDFDTSNYINVIILECEADSPGLLLIKSPSDDKVIFHYQGVFFVAEKKPWYSWLYSWF